MKTTKKQVAKLMNEMGFPVYSTDYVVTELRCIYFLFLKGVLQYVGSTGCLVSRLEVHKTPYDDYLYIPFQSDDREFVESVERPIIRMLMPPQNKRIQKAPASKGKVVDRVVTKVIWRAR
jgi:hypothetical protein